MEHEKIIFPLKPDEYGYPPSEYEGLWVVRKPNGNFLIDSVPFFVEGVSLGDEVSARKTEVGELWFQKLLVPSKHSTFRVIASNREAMTVALTQLTALGCKAEINEPLFLVAFSVAPNSAIAPILTFLMDGKRTGEFDFEEAALRHAI